MCRLFGFRSVINSQVHSSLVHADNALATQSNENPDGWGVAYYALGSPHVVKSSQIALTDKIFQKVSGVVASHTVLAHIRKTTIGDNSILNTHPFQFGHWVFAHNGNIKNFKNHRDELLRRVNPELRRFILGDTDSELIFFFILSHLETKVDLSQKDCPIEILATSIQESIKVLVSIVGDFVDHSKNENTETYFTFIMTNGSTMVAHQGGQELHYSTYKTICGDSDNCPSFSPECINPTETGLVNHLIFSSEPLSGENIWIPLKMGQVVGVDAHMKLKIF